MFALDGESPAPATAASEPVSAVIPVLMRTPQGERHGEVHVVRSPWTKEHSAVFLPEDGDPLELNATELGELVSALEGAAAFAPARQLLIAAQADAIGTARPF